VGRELKLWSESPRANPRPNFLVVVGDKCQQVPTANEPAVPRIGKRCVEGASYRNQRVYRISGMIIIDGDGW